MTMSSRSHKKNKYAALATPHGTAKSLRGIFTDTKIKIQISPDRYYTLDFSFLDSRPQMQKAFLEFLHILGESVGAKTKQNYLRYIRNFVMFLNEYEEKNDIAYRE